MQTTRLPLFQDSVEIDSSPRRQIYSRNTSPGEGRGIGEGMVVFVIALLSFADSTPRA